MTAKTELETTLEKLALLWSVKFESNGAGYTLTLTSYESGAELVYSGAGLAEAVANVREIPEDEQEFCAECDAPVFPPETTLNDEGVCNLCSRGDDEVAEAEATE